MVSAMEQKGCKISRDICLVWWKSCCLKHFLLECFSIFFPNEIKDEKSLSIRKTQEGREQIKDKM